MRNKRKASKSLDFVVTGLTLILIVSLLDGFIFSFVNALRHIISDLTIDIKVHTYIVGLILLIYGLYKRSRK